jgi:hypothetical protein
MLVDRQSLLRNEALLITLGRLLHSDGAAQVG